MLLLLLLLGDLIEMLGDLVLVSNAIIAVIAFIRKGDTSAMWNG